MGVAFGSRPTFSSVFFPPSRPHNIAYAHVIEARRQAEAAEARSAAEVVLRALHRRQRLCDRAIDARKQWVKRRKVVKMADIAAEVAVKHGLTVLDLMSDRRGKAFVDARWEAWWRCSTETRHGLSEIGRFFRHDHATVRNALIRYRDRKLAGEA